MKKIKKMETPRNGTPANQPITAPNDPHDDSWAEKEKKDRD